MNEPVSILKGTGAYKDLRHRFSDHDRRMNSLYAILNEQGVIVPYRRREAQAKYARDQWLLDIIVKSRQLGFCQSPETPVLTADLEWLSLDEITVGQRIMACDEESPKVRGSARKLRVAVVEKKFEVWKEAVELEFETGAKLVATLEHRYLIRPRGYVQPRWQRVNQLRIGDVVRVVTDHWGPTGAEDAWFAGLLDGEGSVRRRIKSGVELSISQVAGAVLDRARAYLEKNFYTYREEVDRRKPGRSSKLGSKPVHKLRVTRSGEIMRILGQCRPSRFGRQFWEGQKLPGDGNSWIKIVGIRMLPPQRMIDLQTSEKTFIAKGFVSHNSSEIAIDICDHCLWRKNFTAGIIDYTLDDAKLKLQKVRTAYIGTPAAVRETVRLIKDNEEELKWSNGSTCYVGTSHRGGTLQYLHICLTGDTGIYTHNAIVKPISQVKAGDKVLTSKGSYREVRSVIKNRFADVGFPLLEVSAFGWYAPLKITSNHKVLTRERRTGRRIWKRAGELVRGDYLAMPIREPSNGLRGGVSVGDDRRIDPDPNLGWLCGMYLAEGTIRHRYGKRPTDVTFSLDRGEVALVVRAIERLGLVFAGKAGGKLIRVATHKDSKTRTVTVNSKCLAGFLSDHFGFGEEKIIPDKIWKWGAPFLHGLIKGYFDGDGHYGTPAEISAVSTRRQFIDQFRLLLISLRYGVPAVYFAPSGKRYNRNCKDTWTIKLFGAANWKFREKHGFPLPEVNTRSGKWRIKNGRRPEGRKNWRRGANVYWCRISGVKEIEAEEFVYDLALDIEPHDYLTVNGIVHNSEFGKIATDKPDIAREIKTGALNTIAPGQKVKIESTAHGTSGEFYDMVHLAEQKGRSGQTLSQLDFKLHFFAWWMDPKYAIQPNLAVISSEMQEYFDGLRIKHGIILSPDQKAWYVLKQQTLGRDDMRSEFPSVMEETFYNSMEGTWFKKEMLKAREEHRIGHPIPHDPNYLVNTFWDIGLETKNNQNAIWFHQTDGTRHRIIDYYENVGEGIQHYASKVYEIAHKRGFTLGKHYGPHDIGHRSWANDAKTRKEIASDLGIEFEVVPRVLAKEDAIEALRKMLALTWIDAEHCARLVECLDNYRKTWSKQLAQWTSVPLHNYASNAADAGMCGAVGLKPDNIALADGSRSKDRKKVRGSQWAQ